MEKKDVGVIVARFQVDSLTAGHNDLIEQVVQSHYKTIILLGLSPVKCTVRNPLDFESRKQMILSKFPDVIVLYIKDTYSDVIWSNILDKMIKDVTGLNQEIFLYGSRDSFIKYYSGKYECVEVEQTVYVSGTDVRKLVSKQIKSSSDFRKGVIWTTMNQYPKCFPTVDACIWKNDKDNTKILLGKRDTEPKYRFVGGFVSPGETYEETVIRESREETGLELQKPVYLKSFVIDDWRYRNEVDKITTSLFLVQYVFGKPVPADDIDELRWFVLDKVIIDNLVDEHQELMQSVLEYFEKV